MVSSLTIHHLPESLRPQAIREMFRVLVPGGSVLIAEFQPPAGRFGRRIISTIHSPAMANNRLDLLQPMRRQAGFEQFRSGDLYPLDPLCAGPQTHQHDLTRAGVPRLPGVQEPLVTGSVMGRLTHQQTINHLEDP